MVLPQVVVICIFAFRVSISNMHSLKIIASSANFSFDIAIFSLVLDIFSFLLELCRNPEIAAGRTLFLLHGVRNNG
jgi:hypothetical protein